MHKLSIIMLRVIFAKLKSNMQSVVILHVVPLHFDRAAQLQP
jgi:hypothetical protein